MPSDRRREVAGIIGQYIGGILLGVGIGLELAKGADVYYVLISAGSAVYAVATKLRRR